MGSLLVLAAAGGSGCGSSRAGAAAAAPQGREALPLDIVKKSALPLYALEGDKKLAKAELWERLASSKVICFGEQHDDPHHHYAQWRALEALATRSAAAQRPLAVGLEMFQRPYQAALTGFISGSLPEAQFLLETEYQERWGFDFSLYRPLLQTARDFSLEALALNAPKELTRKIARSGLSALDANERKQLPELDLSHADHRAYFDAAMAEHPMPSGGPKLDDMYAAQVVWDETMAETAANWLDGAGQAAQLVVFAGAGHCQRSAVPARISRRLNVPVLSVDPVLQSELSEYDGRGRHDVLVVLED